MNSPEFPRIRPQGVGGVVVQFANRLSESANRAALALRSDIEDAGLPGVLETSPALASVYVRFDPAETDLDSVTELLSQRLGRRDYLLADLPHDRRLWRIPAVFGGAAAPHLERAADHAGLSTDEAVASLTAKPVRVLAIGFAPGQPYLGELGPEWDIPRLPDLIDVPAAAVVLAIRQLVLFANASPTGWQHVGQTGFRCYRPERDDAIALRPGDEVLFVPAPEHELADLAADPDGGATCEALP